MLVSGKCHQTRMGFRVGGEYVHYGVASRRSHERLMPEAAVGVGSLRVAAQEETVRCWEECVMKMKGEDNQDPRTTSHASTTAWTAGGYWLYPSCLGRALACASDRACFPVAPVRVPW